MYARYVSRLVGLIGLAAIATACSSGGGTQVVPPVVLGMVKTEAPYYNDGQTTIYQSALPVVLPMRKPSADETPKGGPVDAYPRPPFLLASDVQTTVRFTLSNLDNVQHTVELLLDPWNEFVWYNPGIVVGDEETIPNPSGIDRYFVLPPLARVEGIITPDDMTELAVDLGTAEMIAKNPPGAMSAFAGPALFNRDFNVQNRSTLNDPILAPFRPSVDPGVTGFTLGLRTYEQATLAVELVIDVQDLNGNRVIQDGDTTDKPIGKPGTVLAPPAPPVATGG